MAAINYLDLLKTELNHRKMIDSKYSLRKFSSDLGLSSTYLSNILNKIGKLSLVQKCPTFQKIPVKIKKIVFSKLIFNFLIYYKAIPANF